MILEKNKSKNISQLLLLAMLFIASLLNFLEPLFARNSNDIKEYKLNQIEKVMSFEPNSSGIEFKCLTKNSADTVSVNISFPFIDAVKVDFYFSRTNSQSMFSKKYDISDNDNYIYISTDSVSVHVYKEPWSILYFRGDQKLLNQNGKIFKNDDSSKIVVTSSMYPNEHFYGFGEKFNGLNQRGNKVIMELNDAYKSDDDSTYKSIPFFLSSRKYGVLVNSPKRVVFNMGNKSESEFDFLIPNSSLEYFVFLNNDPLEIMTQYTEITGRSPVVPKWTLEPWLSRRRMTGWTSPLTAESDIDMMINHGFRLGVVLWEGIRSMFSGSHFAQMTKLSDKWHNMGIKQISWGYTGHINKSSVEQSEIDNDYFIRYQDGSLCEGGYSGKNYYVDPTNNKAMDWFLKKYYYKRFLGNENNSDEGAWNLDGIKIDFSELFPKNDSNLLNIDQSIGMHNQHAVLFSEKIYNWLQTIKPEGGITWVRGGGIGLQKVGFSWGGDRGRTFEQLRGTVVASLGVSICGVSLIGHDLGGYRGGDSPAERKVYIRGVQYATFSPSFHDHGSAPGPWEQNEYGIENYSFYSRVRYNILPYLYHFVKVSNDTGIPIMRTLYMHHPDDQNTFTIDDEYYLGSDILVAPILSELNERSIYLPKGNWINFWDQKKYSGKQTILHETALNRIPVFVKEGAILPLELNNNLELGGIFPHEQKNNLLLSFRLFAGQNSKFEYFHDDTISVVKQVNNEKLIVTINNIDDNFAIIVDGITTNKVVVNGEYLTQITKNNFGAVDNGWRYNKLSNQLLIKIGTNQHTNRFNIEIEKMKFHEGLETEIAEVLLRPPKIIKTVGWNKSAVINFSAVKEAESYIVKYWERSNKGNINLISVNQSPILIPNLKNGIELLYSISSVNGTDTSNSSDVEVVIPKERKPFFIPNNGSVFINSVHNIDYNLGNGTSRNYTYGLALPNSDKYSVWLKIKKGHSHFEYFRWYKIGEVDLNKGDNYFELHLVDEDVIPGMIYFSVDGNDRPIMKDEIERDFEEREINIIDKKSLQF